MLLLEFPVFLLQFLIFILSFFFIFFLLFIDFSFLHGTRDDKSILQQSYYKHLKMLQFFPFCQKLGSPALSVDKGGSQIIKMEI